MGESDLSSSSGSGSDDERGSDSDDSSSDDGDRGAQGGSSRDGGEWDGASGIVDSKAVTTDIRDLTEQDLINLRRSIYLTIMSSAGFEECAHKLAKLDIPPGHEMELW